MRYSYLWHASSRNRTRLMRIQFLGRADTKRWLWLHFDCRRQTPPITWRPDQKSELRIVALWRLLLNPPNSFALARTIEYFRIPKDVLTICLGKSTYARCGIIVNVTPLEPEWEGHVTLEFSNTTPLPAKIYANEGVAQMLFFESDAVFIQFVYPPLVF